MQSFRSLLKEAGPRSLSAWLRTILAIVTLTMTAMALASIHFARKTQQGAESLESYAISDIVTASEIALLLERHRRLVESAPLERHPSRVEASRRSSEVIATSIAFLVAGQRDALFSSIAKGLPELLAHGRHVLALSAEGRQSQAVAAIAAYVAVADALQQTMTRNRDTRLAQAARDVEDLIGSGRSLMAWVIGGAGLALLLIFPLAALAIRWIGRRLADITETMRRLARNDTAVVIPSRSDTDEVGDMARAVAVFKENAISLLEKQDEVERLNRWLDIALNNMVRGLSMFGADERLILCNRRYAEMYGLPADLTRPQTPFAEIVAHGCGKVARDGARESDPQTLDTWLAEHRLKVATGVEFSETHRLEDGRVLTLSCQPLAAGGWVDVHEEVTEQIRTAERIAELAHSDGLTGLANRRHFLDEIESAFAALAADPAAQFAVIWIDLDRFKEVNDTYGHPAGDAMLCATAQTLRATARNTDFVARLGGDEFAILLRGAKAGAAASAAVSLANRLERAIVQPVDIGGHKLNVGASIGIAIAPDNGATADELMRNADLALYRAKSDGRGRHILFSGELERSTQENLRLEKELREAIASRRLELQFLPTLDLATRRVTTLEAIVCWHHPELRPIPLETLIPMAEQTGLAGELATWAIGAACQAAASWPKDVAVALDLTSSQLADHELAGAVCAAIASSELEPARLELVVAGSSPASLAEFREMLLELCQMGVTLTLCGFGGTCSSIHVLRDLPFGKVGLAADFVRDAVARPEGNSMLRAVTTLCHMLGMRVVADGIDAHGCLELARMAGVDEGRGMALCGAVSAGDVIEAIQRLARAPAA